MDEIKWQGVIRQMLEMAKSPEELETLFQAAEIIKREKQG